MYPHTHHYAHHRSCKNCNARVKSRNLKVNLCSLLREVISTHLVLICQTLAQALWLKIDQEMPILQGGVTF